MSEEKQTQDEKLESSGAPETPAKGITPKKKQALLTYMTILFVVAFLLVLLSFFIQLRDSRATISELNESSMNALKNAQVLQAANEQLTEENEKLNDQLSAYKEGNAQLAREAGAGPSRQLCRRHWPMSCCSRPRRLWRQMT